MRDLDRATWMLLDAAGPQDWSRQLESLSDLLPGVLGGAARLPVGLAEAVVASDRAALHEALAGNDALLTERPELRDRLAVTGSPGMARIALDRWPLRHRRLALAAARPAEPGWRQGIGVGRAAQGPVSGLLATHDVQRLRAAVGGPFPDLLHHVLRVAGRHLTSAEQLRALLTLHGLEGDDAVRAALDDPAMRPEVVAAVRPALDAADPVAALRGLAEVAEGTAGAIEELCRPDFAERVEHLTLRETLDWPAVLAAHDRRPFDDVAAAALAARPDCPEDIVVALYATSPAAVAAVGAVSTALLLTPAAGKGAAKMARLLARRAIDAGLPGSVLLEHVRPAVSVLDAMRLRPEAAAAGKAWTELSAALEKLVATHIGTDVAAWRALRARLKSFPGTVLELLEAAPGAPSARPGAWPESAALPDVTKATSVTGVRAAFVTLLDAAPTAVQLALLPQFDDRTVHDLLMHGRWRPDWLEHAMRHGPASARLSLAGRGSLDAAAIDRLATLDDPMINGLLFLRANATYAQRTRLLSGPLDPAFKARMLQRAGGWSGRDAIDCADVELQRHILRHVRTRGRIPQLHLLLNLWQRHGKEAAAALLAADIKPANYTRNPFQPAALKTMKQLLARTDDAAALADLRAEVVREETAAAQIESLRMERTDHAKLFVESHDWHWDELLAEHRREPFSEVVVGMMARSRGCPEEFRAEGARSLFPWDSDLEAEVVAGAPAAELLAGSAIEHTYGLKRILDARRMSWAVLLQHGHPAKKVLNALGNVDDPGNSPDHSTDHSPDHLPDRAPGHLPDRAALTALLAASIGDNPDGWVLTLRMLPDFPGTVTELLATAAAVVS